MHSITIYNILNTIAVSTARKSTQQIIFGLQKNRNIGMPFSLHSAGLKIDFNRQKLKVTYIKIEVFFNDL